MFEIWPGTASISMPEHAMAFGCWLNLCETDLKRTEAFLYIGRIPLAKHDCEVAMIDPE